MIEDRRRTTPQLSFRGVAVETSREPVAASTTTRKLAFAVDRNSVGDGSRVEYRFRRDINAGQSSHTMMQSTGCSARSAVCHVVVAVERPCVQRSCRGTSRVAAGRSSRSRQYGQRRPRRSVRGHTGTPATFRRSNDRTASSCSAAPTELSRAPESGVEPVKAPSKYTVGGMVGLG